jgi:hypothetical protein
MCRNDSPKIERLVTPEEGTLCLLFEVTLSLSLSLSLPLVSLAVCLLFSLSLSLSLSRARARALSLFRGAPSLLLQTNICFITRQMLEEHREEHPSSTLTTRFLLLPKPTPNLNGIRPLPQPDTAFPWPRTNSSSESEATWQNGLLGEAGTLFGRRVSFTGARWIIRLMLVFS